MKNRARHFLYRMLCGFLLGLSVIAPGVSGSILAVMLGIYEELIGIIASPFKHFRRNFFYLLPMGLGALLSAALFVKLLDLAFDAYPAQSMILLMGLIAGGLLEVFRHVKHQRFKCSYAIGVLLSLGIVLVMELLEPAKAATDAAQVSFWYLCLAGGVAGVAGMVPGLSVSVIMMMFGIYDYLLKTASGFMSDTSRFISMIIPFGVCFIAGMVLFSRLVRAIFSRYPGFAYYMVLGFMLGTLIAVFPGLPSSDAGTLLVCALLFAAGLLISAGIQLLGKRISSSAEE